MIHRHISLSRVYVDEEIKKRVLDTLDSGQYILHKNCREFEERFSAYIGCKYGVLANSATSVMQLTLVALGIGRGHEVIVPSLTAFPTVEPILHAGARPVFVDTDDHYLINPDLIEEKITKKTKAILPVHLYGQPANMDKIAEVAQNYNLVLLEDSCQAHGALFRGRKTGSLGRAGFFSFYPSKNITFLGDGGIMVTDDGDLAQRVSMLRNHGRREKYIHEFAGFNMRANEIQAAIGLVQLRHLDEFNRRRREIASLYDSLLKDLPVRLPPDQPYTTPVYHMYVIRTEKRDELAAYLKKHHIQTGIHYPTPCHLQPAIKRKMIRIHLPKTEAVCREILSLPIHPTLTDEEVRIVSGRIKAFFQKSCLSLHRL